MRVMPILDLPAFPRPVKDAVIEADYVVVEAPVPDRHRTGAGKAAQAIAISGLEALRPVREARVRHFRRRGGAGFWGSGLALAALCFWVSGGHALVLGHAAPPAPVMGAREGLTLSMLESGVRPLGGRSVLAVEAEIANAAATVLRVPAVEVLIVTGDGVTMRHLLAGPGSRIAPGARQRLASRLPVPGGGVRSLKVAFAS